MSSKQPVSVGDLQRVVMPLFERGSEPAMQETIAALVEEAVYECLQVDVVDVISEFALPLQSRSLAVLLNMPIDEAEEWISWGAQVCHDGNGTGDPQVDRYVERQLLRARREPTEDFFTLLSDLEVKGRPLTREQLLGFARQMFEEDRDTVVNLVANLLAWLSQDPNTLASLRDDPARIDETSASFVACFAPSSRPSDFAGHESGTPQAPHAQLLIKTILEEVTDRVRALRKLHAIPLAAHPGSLRRHSGYRTLLLRFIPR